MCWIRGSDLVFEFVVIGFKKRPDVETLGR
jgi:hypothetical protein